MNELFLIRGTTKTRGHNKIIIKKRCKKEENK
jgi:hypothetical protein